MSLLTHSQLVELPLMTTLDPTHNDKPYSALVRRILIDSAVCTKSFYEAASEIFCNALRLRSLPLYLFCFVHFLVFEYNGTVHSMQMQHNLECLSQPAVFRPCTIYIEHPASLVFSVSFWLTFLLPNRICYNLTWLPYSPYDFQILTAVYYSLLLLLFASSASRLLKERKESEDSKVQLSSDSFPVASLHTQDFKSTSRNESALVHQPVSSINNDSDCNGEYLTSYISAHLSDSASQQRQHADQHSSQNNGSNSTVISERLLNHCQCTANKKSITPQMYSYQIYDKECEKQADNTLVQEQLPQLHHMSQEDHAGFAQRIFTTNERSQYPKDCGAIPKNSFSPLSNNPTHPLHLNHVDDESSNHLSDLDMNPNATFETSKYIHPDSYNYGQSQEDCYRNQYHDACRQAYNDDLVLNGDSFDRRPQTLHTRANRGQVAIKSTSYEFNR